MSIYEILKKTNLPVAYHHFCTEQQVKPPFIIFMTGAKNIGADNGIYQKVSDIRVELYTDKKDGESEERLERVLEEAEIFYTKEEVFIESENLYEVIYESESILL